MTGKYRYMLVLTSGAMEFCWLYAWAVFSMVAIVHRPFPFPEAFIAFLLGGIVTRLCTGHGLRVVQVIFFQVVCLSVAAMIIVYTACYSIYPLFNTGWIVSFFNGLTTPLDRFDLVLTALWTVLLWIAGITFIRRQKIEPAFRIRFDFGLAAFYCLFLIQLIAASKGGLIINDSLSVYCIFPYVFFGLLTIALSRTGRNVPVTALPGRRGIAVIMGFSALVLFSASSLVLFFIPALATVADAGYGVIRSKGGVLASAVERVIRWIYFPGLSNRKAPGSGGRGWDISWTLPETKAWWVEIMEKIMGWGLTGIVILFTVAVLGVLVWYIFRWLFSRTSHSSRNVSKHADIPSIAARLWLFLKLCYKRLSQQLRGYNRAVDIYAALLAWGNRSGLPRLAYETPTEFSNRLARCFPGLTAEINRIVDAFNQEAYGETGPNEQTIAGIRTAMRRLCSPLNWPVRIKIRFSNHIL